MNVKRVPGPGAKKLDNLLKAIKKARVKVGWFESNKYPDGTPVAYVASIHEYGATEQGIPPRPFFRPTITANKQKWKEDTQKAAMAILEGRATLKTVIASIGEQVAGDVRKTIRGIQHPKLEEATVAAKRRKMANKKITGNLRKPLVETGLMYDTLISISED